MPTDAERYIKTLKPTIKLKALVKTIYETGARVSELPNLRICNGQFDGYPRNR